MSTINKLDKIPSAEGLMQQMHTAREILLRPTEKLLSKKNEHKENNDIFYLPVCLEAHIIALIKGGLS